MVAERRRADALARKPTTPEPGSVLQERTGSGASTVAPGSELQQELPVTITIAKHNTNDEPGAALQVQHRVRNINTAPGSAVARFKIRHMVMAQDAHTNAEQRLYLALWSRGRPKDDISRTITLGVLSMAKLASMGETMARQNIRSLIRKLAVEESGGYDCAGAIGKTYRVFNYAEILRRRRDAGLTHYVRRTSAVVFVDPATGQSVEPQPIQERQKPDVPGKTEPGSELTERKTKPDSELPPSSEPGPGSELGGPSLMRMKLGKEEITTSSSVVAAALRKFAPEADDDAVALLVTKCTNVAPDATEDEIAYFARVKAEQGINSRRVRNLVGFLLESVPRCLAGTMLQEYRTAIRQERDRERANWQGILNDPNETEDFKQMARKALASLGG
jgi:hypothetical protein